MTNAESGPQAAPLDSSPRASFWIRELPYILVFILTILGVAYTSYTKKPILGYWELLAPVIALVCISAGWRRAPTRSARVHLIWTQVLHWGAFLLARCWHSAPLPPACMSCRGRSACSGLSWRSAFPQSPGSSNRH